MTALPKPSKAFEIWLNARKNSLAPEVYAKAYRALLTIKPIEMNPRGLSPAMQRMNTEDLKAFADAMAASVQSRG